MAARPNAATPDRQGRVLLAVVVVVAALVFVWLVASLAQAAFAVV